MPVRVGFTGTRQGMTNPQKAAVISLLYGVQAEIVHHGGCIGADIDFDNICWTFHPRGLVTVIHPSNLKTQQGKWHATRSLYPEKPPLERNKDIVDKSDSLIATPKEYEEVLRSGTWATIRYARKQGKPLYIVYPNGSIQYKTGSVERSNCMSKELDLEKEGTLILKYHDQVLHVVPINPYRDKAGKLHTSNIRIFPRGGGLRPKLSYSIPTSFLLRKTDWDGTLTNYDVRINTTCIEVEPRYED